LRKYIGATIGLVDAKHWTRLGKAYPFFEFLITKQTSPDGKINYGRPITYAWILQQVPNAKEFGLNDRKVRRLMAICKRHGYVEIARQNSKPDLCIGMIVRIAKPKKWATQIPLFHSDFHRTTVLDRRILVGGSHQKAADKTLTTRKREEKVKTRTQTPRAIPSPDEHRNRIQNRNKRLLRDMDVAREVACGGPVEVPRSWRDLHPSVFREIAELAKAKAM
jgi:hypothetical protein